MKIIDNILNECHKQPNMPLEISHVETKVL